MHEGSTAFFWSERFRVLFEGESTTGMIWGHVTSHQKLFLQRHSKSVERRKAKLCNTSDDNVFFLFSHFQCLELWMKENKDPLSCLVFSDSCLFCCVLNKLYKKAFQPNSFSFQIKKTGHIPAAKRSETESFWVEKTKEKRRIYIREVWVWKH